MPTLQEQLDELNAAIAAGVRQVTIGGETTAYNTSDSLIRARDDVERRLRAENVRPGQPVGAVKRLHYGGRGYT